MRRREVREEAIDALLRRARHATANSALDLAVQPPEGGRSLALHEVFAGFRRLGLAPHPWGEASDEAVAHNLLATYQPGLLAQLACEGLTEEATGTSGSPCAMHPGILAETDVQTDPRMVVNQAKPYPSGASEAQTYGDVFEAFEDLARVKAGLTRALQGFDLCWSALVPTGQVPRPRRIVEVLCEDDFSAFASFSLLAIAWWLGGAKVAVVPRLFASMFNNTLYNNVGEGLEINEEGWDEWYWEFEGFGNLPASRRPYQQHALTVLWERWDDAYQQECARRKALAVAAFGTAVGAYLHFLHGVFHDLLCANIKSFIPMIECGNEMDLQEWDKYVPDEMQGLEYGRFHALLAGPICMATSWHPRFRVAELLSPFAEHPWSQQRDWLDHALNDGIEGEVLRWTDYYAEFAIPGADAARWLDTCAEADFMWPPWSWPPSLPSSRELVHEVGFHWYREDESGSGYGSDYELWSQVQDLKTLLSGALASWRLTWSVSEVGFMAESDPDDYELSNLQAPSSFSDGFPPLGDWGFQAGELVRRMLLLRASGAERVGWHTRMARVVQASSSDGWTEFSTHGLRNDLQYHRAFVRGMDAWRRPSWFAYRRLVWLLSQSESSEVLACEETGLVVVRLVASSGFSLPEDGGTTLPSRGDVVPTETGGTATLGPSYRYAYVAWVDQSASSPGEIWLVDQHDRGYQQVSLVPRVPGADVRSGMEDDLGYPADDSPEWSWSGWAEKQCSVTEVAGTAGSTWLRVHLDPLENEALRCSPACLLTDAEYCSLHLVGVPEGFDPSIEGDGERPEMSAEAVVALRITRPNRRRTEAAASSNSPRKRGP